MPGLPKSQQSVQAHITFIKKTEDGSPLHTYLYELPKDQSVASNVIAEEHETTITDLRTVSTIFTLKQHGFKLEQLHVPAEIDWKDEKQVKAFPECVRNIWYY